GSEDNVDAIAVQADGKILLAGTTSFGNVANTASALVRLQPDGSLDPTFGGTGDGGVAGVVRGLFGNSYEGAWALSLLPGGKALVLLDALGAAGSWVSRVDATGAVDMSFGGGTGKATFTAASKSLYGMAVQTDGKIVVGGSIGLGGNDAGFGLVRFDSSG